MMVKKLFAGLVVIFFVLTMGVTAFGGDYPSSAVQFLIPFGAGGSADFMGRAIAKATEKFLGKPIVAVNRPGAGGGIMYTALKNAKPDGYTLGWSSTGILTVTNIGNVPFSYDAFSHVCRVGYSALPIAVRSDSPWKTFEEFVAYAKGNPGKIKIGNAGTGSATHLVPIVMEQKLDLKFIHVPLGAKRRVPSLLGGEVEAVCVPLPEIAPQVRAGKARVLVVPSEKRDPGFPDVPTLKEMGHDIVIELFRSVSVVKGIPGDVIKKIEAAFEKGVQESSFLEISKKNSFNVSYMNSQDFEAYVKTKNAMIAEVMAAAGLKK